MPIYSERTGNFWFRMDHIQFTLESIDAGPWYGTIRCEL